MKLVIAVLAGLFGATSALAADLPARTYTKAPVMVDPGFNWTGFYVGGNLGYGWGRSSDTSSLTNGAGTTLFTTAGSSNLNGVVGGGQIGYNWQVQNWLWGLEAAFVSLLLVLMVLQATLGVKLYGYAAWLARRKRTERIERELC